MKKQFAENKIELGGGIVNDFDFEGLGRNGGGSYDFEGLDRWSGGGNQSLGGGGGAGAPRVKEVISPR